jgi:hypothetical protein
MGIERMGHTSRAMKRALLILLIGCVAVVLGRSAADAGSGATRPTLRPLGESGMTLRGTGFKKREHVRVVVTTRTRTAKSLTASAAGAFTVTFAGMNANTCAGFGATAVGSDGSRATYKRAPGMCPVP